jgi:hypothetical protein
VIMGGCVCLLLLRVEQIMSPSAHASDFVSSEGLPRAGE